MLLAMRRWRSDRSCSAWPWKSSESVNLLSIASLVGCGRHATPMELRLDVEALSERGPANISANSAAFAALFASLADGARFYSGAMLSIALLAPLARVAPRRLAWGLLVVCGLLVAALPANGEE